MSALIWALCGKASALPENPAPQAPSSAAWSLNEGCICDLENPTQEIRWKWGQARSTLGLEH